MRVVIATHEHCFDGLASAALFTHLLQQREGRPMEVRYVACGYGPSQQRPSEQLLDGGENAILDFRYLASSRLTWYFDHHRTAFATPEDAEHFQSQSANGQFFFDADYSSCTKLIADVSRDRFGVHEPALDPLVEWANIVDSAAFESPSQASDFSNPLMRLMSVVEHHGDSSLIGELVPELLSKPLQTLAEDSSISQRFERLGSRYERFRARVEERAKNSGEVVFVDLTDSVTDIMGKFVTYSLFPTCKYSVVVTLLRSGVKISVGYNPWSGKQRDADISAICARFGGGGHPVVGGVSFPTDQLERARSVARAIMDELNGHGSSL